MFKTVMTSIDSLTYNELEKVSDYITQKILFDMPNTDLLERIADKKYPKRVVCPHCGSVVVVKYGKFKGKQRYKCKDCNKTFNLFTGSIISNSNVPLNIWTEFTKMLLNNKFSLREASDKLKLSVPTVFYMRHKILSKLSQILTTEMLSGKIQIDETFVPENFKGNHKHSKSFTMPRKSYHRGGERTTALNDKSCIITAMDNDNNLIIKQEGLGKPGTNEINAALLNNIEMGSIMVTDGLNAYQNLSIILGCQHEIVISTEKKNKKGYTLNQINSIHSALKRWLKLFNGVATKYLDNYLVWFSWLQRTKSTKDIDKYKELIVNCVAL